MLGKRDPIFWAASAIFVVAIVLGAAVDNAWLLLMVAAYLLRPTLHSLGLFKKLIDERQLHIQYRASSVGFAAMLIGNIVLVLVLMSKGDHTWEMVNAVVLVALVVRALAGLLMVGDPAVAGSRIIMAIGLLLALFGALEGDIGGVMSHVLPGLAVVALGFAARRVPRAIALALFVLAALFGGFIVLRGVQGQLHGGWGGVLGPLMLIVPMLVAGGCLWMGVAPGDDAAREHSEPRRGTATTTGA